MPPGVLASLARGVPGAKRTKMRQQSLGDAVQCWFPEEGGGLGWEEGAVSWVEPGGAHFRVTYDGEEYSDCRHHEYDGGQIMALCRGCRCRLIVRGWEAGRSPA